MKILSSVSVLQHSCVVAHGGMWVLKHQAGNGWGHPSPLGVINKGVADRKDGNYTVFATFCNFIWIGDLRKHTHVRTHTHMK